MADASSFEATYRDLHEWLDQASRDLSGVVTQAIAQIGSPFLVRGAVDGARVKSLQSVFTKCQRKGLEPHEICSLGDLVGLRVVCANLEDVDRLVGLIKGIAEIEVVAIQKKKSADGYRAVHVDIHYPVRANGKTVVVPCELQIRTYLQDSWAKQTHQDLYKIGRAPVRVRRLSKSLAKMLDAADEIAQQIREEVSQRRPRKGKLPDGVTPRGLGLIYQQTFGEPAPDYLLQIVQQRCEEEGVDRLDALDRLLGDRSTRHRLCKAYTETASFPVDGYESHLAFEFAPVALRHGVDAAIALIRKRTVADDVETEGIYRREALSDLPKSFEAFMDLFVCRDKDDDPSECMARYASALGATSRCSHCNSPRLSDYDFAGEIQKYYGVENREAAILKAIWDSGADSCRTCGAN